MRVYVILPAAGIGTRMAASTNAPKQFVSLRGVPVLIHSLRAFLQCPRVAGISIAVRRHEMERVGAELRENGFGANDLVRVVEGGDSRQHSVQNALAGLSCEPDDLVLVHDAVRPLIDSVTIERTIDAVVKHGAAIVGLPAIDTVKQVERTAHGAIVTSTIPRELIVLAQTPQGARYDLLKRAFDEAEADEFAGTDEASLLERAGVPVAVVQGTPGTSRSRSPETWSWQSFTSNRPRIYADEHG